jgi:hypothetical protein
MKEHEDKMEGLMKELRNLCNDVRKTYKKAIKAMADEKMEKEILSEITAEKDALKLVEAKDIVPEKKPEKKEEPKVPEKKGRQYDVEDPFTKLEPLKALATG